MEGTVGQMERDEPGLEDSRHTNGVRCIIDRVGGVMQWHTDSGPWSREKKGYHINCMELLTASLTVKSFLKYQVNKHVLLLIYNRTAVTFISNLDGTTSPQSTVLQCSKRPLDVEPEESNTTLGTISPRRGECQGGSGIPGDEGLLRLEAINPLIFQKILEYFPKLSIDLFTSRLTYQLLRFFRWRPDPPAKPQTSSSKTGRGGKDSPTLLRTLQDGS